MKYWHYPQKPMFTVQKIDVQRVSRPKGYKHAFKYGRAKHGFIYVVSGMMRNSFSDARTKIDVKAGELIFIPKGTVYTGEYLEDNTQIEIIQFNVVSGELPEYLSQPIKLTFPNVRECMSAFFRFEENHNSDHSFYYLSAMYHFLWQLDENHYKMPKKYKKLQPALSELSERWHENQSVLYYASLCNMSEANFRRLFHEYTEKTPIEYRNELRLVNARARLRSGEYTVTETAESCGFDNLSYFIRSYKKRFGCTPKKQ